jgi:hypothetical protein
MSRSHLGHRRDANHDAVVQALEQIGASVADTHTLGDGFPDLVVGWRGENFLLEIKDGRKPKSRRVLTSDEQKWFDNWRGTAYVVYSGADAVALLTRLTTQDDGLLF